MTLQRQPLTVMEMRTLIRCAVLELAECKAMLVDNVVSQIRSEVER